MKCADLTRYLHGLLGPGRVKDCCSNGLQLEVRDEFGLLATGVSARLALLRVALKPRSGARRP